MLSEDPQNWRFGVLGAGAIGSLVAGRLALAGKAVTLIGRGDRLAELKQNGVAIEAEGRRLQAKPDLALSGDRHPCDILFVAVKSVALAAALPAIQAACHEGTVIVPLINGLPWWYGGEASKEAAAIVDPEGHFAASIPEDRVIGAVVFARASMNDDGTVLSEGGERLAIGPAGTGDLALVQHLAKVLSEAGIATQTASNIRQMLWAKLALNLATNPLSAVTGATLRQMCEEPELLSPMRAVLGEVLALAKAEGYLPEQGVDALVTITANAGPFLTSMAQDLQAGRQLELGAIAYAPLALAKAHGLAMPVSQTLAELAGYASKRLS